MKINHMMLLLALVVGMHSSAQGAPDAADGDVTRQCGEHRLGLRPHLLVVDNQEYLESGIFDSISGEYLYLDHTGRAGVMLFAPEDSDRSYIYFVAKQGKRLRPSGAAFACYPLS